MNAEDDAPPAATCASPPCFMHELDPLYGGADEPVRPTPEWTDVKRWRKAERQRLIETRLAIDADLRALHAAAIAEFVNEQVGEAMGKVISLYWPFRGEPDLRVLIEHFTASGARCALPVVVERGQPLIFREWKPGDRLERGIWNIPVPADGADVLPDVVIAPVVGFDPAHYRLGYGGGFYDRTFAVLPQRPRAIGVGYEMARLPTIYPQPHDVSMDVIVTEKGFAAS